MFQNLEDKKYELFIRPGDVAVLEVAGIPDEVNIGQQVLLDTLDIAFRDDLDNDTYVAPKSRVSFSIKHGDQPQSKRGLVRRTRPWVQRAEIGVKRSRRSIRGAPGPSAQRIVAVVRRKAGGGDCGCADATAPGRIRPLFARTRSLDSGLSGRRLPRTSGRSRAGRPPPRSDRLRRRRDADRAPLPLPSGDPP